MAEYIKKDTIEKFIKDGLNNPDKSKAFGHDAIEILEEIHFSPAADVEEAKHGRWDKVSWWQHQNRYECNECSLCGCRVKPKFTYNFCPNCGAKMDGGEENADN